MASGRLQGSTHDEGHLFGASLALILMPQAVMAQQSPTPNAPPPPVRRTTFIRAPARPQAEQDIDESGPDAMHGGRLHHHRPPPPPIAARFRIEAGDITLGMVCPEDEPLKACQDFAL